jgi:CheY-like chemotaxis protein
MKQILVVDDDAQIRSMLRTALEHEGYNVQEARDGKEAISNLIGQNIKLIITDIVMPEKEGLETIMEMRRDSPDIKIIAISGSKQYLHIAKILGADYVYSKPFSILHLIDKVNEFLLTQRQ